MSNLQLVRGRWIFTGDDCLTDGAIALQDDKVLAVGSWETLRSQYPDSPVYGSSHHAVLPGLINAHHHSNGVPNSLQGVDDDFLELWLFANIALRPWVAPEANPLHVVLMRARAADVDTVFVNGKVVLQGGQPTGFDLQAVGQAIAEQLEASPNREQYHALAQEMRPYLANWYTNWGEPSLGSYAAFNSRQ